MKKILFILFFLPLYCMCQTAIVSDYNLNRINTDTNGIIMKYPVVTTTNNNVDAIINKKINYTLFSTETFPQRYSVDTIITELKDYGLTDISYTVNYNDKYILSLIVYIEYCRAYCTDLSFYFNFDITNGEIIKLKDIFKPDYYDAFTKTVTIDKAKQIAKNKEDLTDDLKKNIITKEDYDWAIEETNKCPDIVDFRKYTITEEYIEIGSPCDFPHVIQNLAPAIDLKYSWDKIKDGINERYKGIFIK